MILSAGGEGTEIRSSEKKEKEEEIIFNSRQLID